MRPLLSICIPSYNRPTTLAELLQSIDCDGADIEIVICEDASPRREAIGRTVKVFASQSEYVLRYFENETNLGYDGNVRRTVGLATGRYVMLIGDDDLFVPGGLEKFLDFLRHHADKKYILRSYVVVHPDGSIENFKYLPRSTVIPPGEASVAWLFKRSVTICGFTISRDEAVKYATSALDGTLLYQVYLMAQVCLENESVYCDFPVAQAVQSFKTDIPHFGNAAAERGRYTPGHVTQDNSINFTKAFFEVTGYIDQLRGTQITQKVRNDLSKYAYPFLSIQRKTGVKEFLRYASRLETEAGLGVTAYYYLYKWALVVFGQRVCDQIILRIKGVLGHTPSL